MKTLILASGFGTMLSEETDLIPKPQVRIGKEPILVHIMRIYRHFGFNEFVVLLGTKGQKKENIVLNISNIAHEDDEVQSLNIAHSSFVKIVW